MEDRFEVTVGAGTMMSRSGAAICFPHRWTPDGVEVTGLLSVPRRRLATVGSLLGSRGRGFKSRRPDWQTPFIEYASTCC